MPTRLCKLSRGDIISSLGEVERVVSNSTFVCRSCARSANQANRLCKPFELGASKQALTQESTSVKVIKLSKKQLKQQEKTNKKIKKMIKKQTKLLKKANKLKCRLEHYQSSVNETDSTPSSVHIH